MLLIWFNNNNSEYYFKPNTAIFLLKSLAKFLYVIFLTPFPFQHILNLSKFIQLIACNIVEAISSYIKYQKIICYMILFSQSFSYLFDINKAQKLKEIYFYTWTLKYCVRTFFWVELDSFSFVLLFEFWLPPFYLIFRRSFHGICHY